MTKIQNSKQLVFNLIGDLGIVIWNLPFDYAQGGEHVEPFGIWCL